MTLKEILDNSVEIIECAKAFRYDATYLMTELAKDFDFSLAEGEGFPKQVYQHKYNNKGIFRGEWSYYFHGAECRFDNLTTGQIVELIHVVKPEFGFLDGYFFYNYMVTTARFKELANWFENYSNVWDAIEVLADQGLLTRIMSVFINRNIIAL